MPPLPVAFAGTSGGPWRVDRSVPVTGPPLPPVSHVTVVEGPAAFAGVEGAAWVLRGVTSNERYVTQEERDALIARQEGLGRPSSTCAALIPIRKSEEWWSLPQDRRRRIFEDRSHHVAIGLGALPAVARRLHHGRDLLEPFDFLTWFEYPPAEAEAFEDLVRALRRTEEWRYVEHEVDIRLTRA